jgi:hypothetical protein
MAASLIVDARVFECRRRKAAGFDGTLEWLKCENIGICGESRDAGW